MVGILRDPANTKMVVSKEISLAPKSVAKPTPATPETINKNFSGKYDETEDVGSNVSASASKEGKDSTGKPYREVLSYEFINDPEPDDPKVLAVYNQLQTQIDNKRFARENQIRDLEAIQKKMANTYAAQPVSLGVDITPIAALVDAQTGSNLAPTIGKPMNLQEKINTINSFSDSIQKNKIANEEDAQKLGEFKLEYQRKKRADQLKADILRQQLGAGLFKSTMGPGSMAKEAKPDKPKPLPADKEMMLADAQSAIYELRKLQDKVARYHMLFGGPFNAKDYATKFKSLFPGLDAEQALRNLQSEFMANMKSIASAMEKGRISDKDMDWYNKMFGDMLDSPETVRANLRGLEQRGTERLKRQVQALQKNFIVGAADNMPDSLVKKDSEYKNKVPSRGTYSPNSTNIEKAKSNKTKSNNPTLNKIMQKNKLYKGAAKLD